MNVTHLDAVIRFNAHMSHEELRYKWHHRDATAVPIPHKTSTSHLDLISKLS